MKVIDDSESQRQQSKILDLWLGMQWLLGLFFLVPPLFLGYMAMTSTNGVIAMAPPPQSPVTPPIANENDPEANNTQPSSPHLKEWTQNGPDIPPIFTFSDFTIKGYVQGKWPIVIDFQLERPGMAHFTVKTDNGKIFSLPLDSSKTDRQMLKFQLSDEFGTVAQPARIIIKAIDKSSGTEKPLPIRIFGIAVGPRAVGSVGIDQLSLKPKSIQISQKQKTNYAFFSHIGFNKVVAEFRKIVNSNDIIKATDIVKKDDIGKVVPNEWIGKDSPRTWDGKTERKQPSIGFHLLQIRAWYADTNPDQLRYDWVASWSPEWVSVKK
jgi:hypothetical protein